MPHQLTLWIIAAVVVLDLLFIGGAFIWMVRRVEALKEEIASSVGSRERMVVPPVRADFSGGSRRFGRIRGSGIFALTDRRIIFRKLIGAPVEIALDEIESVTQARFYRGTWKAGLHNVIVRLRDGDEAGFGLRDPRPVLDAVERAIANR